MRSVESSAKTMEEAISLGLEKLEASIADVTIDILDEGSKGFLGILGSKPVVVRLTLRDEPEEDESVLSSVNLQSVVKAPEKKPQRRRAKAEPKVDQNAKPVEAASASEAPKPERRASKAAEKRTAGAPKPMAAEAPKTEAPKAEAPVETAPVQAAPCDPETPEGKAQSFLLDVTRLMGVNVTVNARRDEEGNVRVDMFGDTLGVLIGRRGETLDALQYLTSLYVNRGQEGYTRVTLDTENYRAKREEALRRLANRMANRAVKTGRKVVMEPMNPYERRILHSALQQNEAVTTHSEGEEPNRHVVITLK